MAEITEIRRVSRGSRRRRVYLDGSEWASTAEEVVRELGLRVGQTCDPDELEQRVAAAEPGQAWERALRLLDFRERGSGELRQRLGDDGYQPAVVESVLHRALDLGFLDDRRFAEGLARASFRKGRGRRRIAAELNAKAVDEGLASAILEECCGAEAERERAVAAAGALLRRSPLDARRLAARLVSRGFEAGTAWSAAQQAREHADASSDVE